MTQSFDGLESIEQKDFESFMMQYKPELRDFKKVGESTYSNTLTSIAYDSYLAGAASRQQEVDKLQTEIESLTKDYQELTEMYIQQGINLYKHQSLIKEALDFAKEAHSDLNIGMLKMVYILKGENDEEVD